MKKPLLFDPFVPNLTWRWSLFPANLFSKTKHFTIQFFKKTLLISLLFTATIMMENSLQACGGTPVPPCTGKSVFIAKFTPTTVVFPAAGPINIPIGVLPFAFWDTRQFCPFPNWATLTLTLTCFPSGITIGPQAYGVPAPSTPGAQPLGGPLIFTIPAGVFPPGTPPQVCLVSGTYTVSFSDGAVLPGTGDTEVCLVDPTPLDPTVPRLDLSYISEDGALYKSCRKGDQAILHFLLANNDPNYSVTVDVNSLGRQVAHFPDNTDPQTAFDNGIYSISLSQVGTDTYAAEFAENVAPGQLLAEPDPHAVDFQELNKTIFLPPQGATIISIVISSYGMCANGSCNERLVKVEGTFEDGSPALACASTLLVVDEVLPKTVLCEFSDQIKTLVPGDVTWSPAQYLDNQGPILHAQSHFVGNLAGGNFRTTGNVSSLYPSAATDYIRLRQEATQVQYSVDYLLPETCNGIPVGGFNNVFMHGIHTATPVLSNFPVIYHPEFPSLDIFLDVINDQLIILGENFDLYLGSATSFLENPPPDFCVYESICRNIRKMSNPSVDKTVHVVPTTVSRLFESPTPVECQTVEVYDNNTAFAPWTAVMNGNGVSLTATSGTGTLEMCYDQLAGLPLVPATTLAYLNVSCPGALNNALSVPVAIRMKNNALPLKWLTFEAQPMDRKIQLEWSVADILNTKGFEIERHNSTDVNAPTWQSIGWVEDHQKGNYYTFEDHRVFANQTYYYRLKQVDENGQFSYSEIISAQITGKNEVLYVSNLVPNPAQTYSEVNIFASQPGELRLSWYNTLGQLMTTEKIKIDPGEVTLPFEVSKWRNGIYFLVLEFENKRWIHRLVVN